MKFQVIGLPRTATTWAANWLTDNDAICYHDPLSYKTIDELKEFKPDFDWGISCSASWIAPKWLNGYDCPRIILDRDPDEIDDSLIKLGLPVLTDEMIDKFFALSGPRIYYTDLFDPISAREIWKHLRGTEFNEERHKILCEMHIEPEFSKWHPDLSIITKLMIEGE